ncbi:frag1/DRAM/Sfk1 family protein [Hirsutella rhossiliensis]|uniref:Frag1/DRAM/Sfk1 family domain-containing protein n=1 Tax=Hirsutella rhossiliensis TaxID=111463 RepID=A0A9P8MYQ3_9HYPO|nr:frag1/DRAM/Sfk1 family domain-containing protein [Hirsutella rhossiliensis]KAH0964838.1 frag1/DRAM/Sfk1 family domain-containing protein [Hirsutella rhossiliensis]
MALRGLISYWTIPVLSSLVWLGMLLGLLLHWIIDTHRRHYPSMSDRASIAYISNVGAHELKPLFIAGSVATTLTLDSAFVAERWLRHSGRLVPNASPGEKALAILTIAFALVGTAGLILLSIFDTWRFHGLHDIFLLLFIAGYLFSAVFTCWESQRLGIKNRQHRVLRASFWVKLTFVLVELVLAIIFAATSYTRHTDVAAVFEWVVAFIFTFYILSFVIDLYPAVATRDPGSRFEKPRFVDEAAAVSAGADPDDAAASSNATTSASALHPRDYPMDRNPINF